MIPLRFFQIMPIMHGRARTVTLELVEGPSSSMIEAGTQVQDKTRWNHWFSFCGNMAFISNCKFAWPFVRGFRGTGRGNRLGRLRVQGAGWGSFCHYKRLSPLSFEDWRPGGCGRRLSICGHPMAGSRLQVHGCGLFWSPAVPRRKGCATIFLGSHCLGDRMRSGWVFIAISSQDLVVFCDWIHPQRKQEYLAKLFPGKNHFLVKNR